jgi:serine/threonine kinase 32
LKPDNILLDAMGHAHITDFNVAVHYSERRMHSSVAGSMAYMAPQVVARKGYTWAIDWWSLGVTAYELLFHKRPFDGRSSEKMTQAILKDPLKFPDDASTKCSEAGISALRSVSSLPHYFRGQLINIISSSLIETTTPDWDAG